MFHKLLIPSFLLAVLVCFSMASSARCEDGHGVDPTSGHAGSTLTKLTDWKSDKSLWSLVVFGILFGGLYAVAWKPISQGLAMREQGIATQLADAKRASEEAMAKLKEYDVKLQAAHTQAQDLLVQARKDAETAGQRIVAEAQAEATRQRDRALTDIESAKQAALSELSGKSTDIAFSLARRVVGRELKKEDHQQLIADALTKMPSRN
jgi:F-type H+-transporting ATPase subunit b